MNSTWYLLLAPLVSAALILVWLRNKPLLPQLVSIFACAVAFVIALGLKLGHGDAPDPLVWADLPGLRIEIGFMLDDLARTMLLVVTGVGLLIHIFSIGYMAEDPGRARFFAKLSLFMFSMIGIVLANNLIMMFMFWELVGVSSYLLIGFWFERPSAADAAKKAFITNRIGDFGFILGILLFWSVTGTVLFTPAVTGLLQASPLLTAMSLLLFCGCVGKSAMVPLHVWLPDAMEGPTPVSALIHAATMVAAGVYMLCRIYFVLELSPDALWIIALVGGGTALFAALIATQQNDIKRILAFSTLSQLGYMVMAVGCGGPNAAMFHLTTHAFFKALLFLGAGSVIHALHHEQDIWKMGALRSKMPVTFGTFLIATLALTGFPGLAGFFSKDAILAVALERSPVLFALGAGTAALTSFYMLRLVIVAFFGKPRSEAAAHAHESPAVMTAPLLLLAVLSVVGGWLGIDHVVRPEATAPHEHHALVVGVSVAVFALGLLAAWAFYGSRNSDPLAGEGLSRWFRNKFYIDEFYDGVLLRLQQGAAILAAWVDNWILGMVIVRGSAWGAALLGEVLRLFQPGNLQSYAFLFSLGVVAIFYVVLFR
jgi:NADH-quinone oxidoreductase subunit L